jgi:hypothetical protein
VVVNWVIAFGEFFESLKQVFQAQVSAHTFVEGMFVQNHAENGSRLDFGNDPNHTRLASGF